jgi:signal transduction histidine kinase
MAWLSNPMKPILAVLAAILLCPFPSAAQTSGKDGLDPVALQLKWQHQFQFAGYYAAVEKGFYREAGLAVELRSAEPGQQPMEEVTEGRAEFGVGTTDLLIMQDQGLPVRVLAAIMQHSPLALATLRDGGTTNIHRLASVPVMVEPHSAELLAYFTREGVSPEKLDLVEHSFDLADLVTGRVGAMSVYTTDEPYALREGARDYLLFRPIESGIDFYGDNLFTTAEQINDYPERVQAFLDASLRGWRYAMENPEEIADLIIDRYSKRKTRDALLFEAAEMRRLMNPDIVEIGYVNPDRWRRIAETYASLGYIRGEPDVGRLIYRGGEDPDWALLLRIAVGASILLILSTGILLVFMRQNRRLRREMAERAELQGRLEEMNRQKDLLLSIIGHDLKTPFNVLLVYGEMLSNGVGSMDQERLRRIAGNIRDASASAFELLNNLLDWASLQTGIVTADRKPVPIDAIIETAIDMQRPLAQAKNIAVDIEVEDGLSAHCDPRMIETVIRNLAGNAVKFTEPGGQVILKARVEDGRAAITVTDTGVGMNDAERDNLLSDAPSQSLRGTSGERGTGIGLSLCRRIIDANDGTLSADSAPGKGTSVTFTLPLAGQP